MMDVTRTQEVWNQAVYKYESEILKEREGSSSGSAQGTVREKDILSKVWYVSEPLFPFSKDGLTSLKGKPIYTEKSALDEKWYFYRVELDKDNKIIGGEWLKPGDYSSYFEKGISSDDDRFFEDRPDFLWDETPPVFYGRFSKLKNLYEASTGKETTEASPPTPTDYMMGLNRGILKVNNYFTKKIKKRVGLFRKKVDEFNLVGEMTYEGKGELIFWRMKRLSGTKEELQPRIPFDSVESAGKFHAKFTLSSLKKINTSRITLGFMVNGKIIDSLSYRFEDLANLLDR
jgi:hypothetical protein